MGIDNEAGPVRPEFEMIVPKHYKKGAQTAHGVQNKESRRL